MKLHLTSKILFGIMGLLLVLAILFVAIEYPKLKQQAVNNPPVKTEANGSACSPDSAVCKGNPELCMTENLNKVCD